MFSFPPIAGKVGGGDHTREGKEEETLVFRFFHLGPNLEAGGGGEGGESTERNAHTAFAPIL